MLRAHEGVGMAGMTRREFLEFSSGATSMLVTRVGTDSLSHGREARRIEPS
jgi:hypothetical protein